MIVRYIEQRDVARYLAEGWSVSLMAGHHGAKGRHIAVREAPS